MNNQINNAPRLIDADITHSGDDYFYTWLKERITVGRSLVRMLEKNTQIRAFRDSDYWEPVALVQDVKTKEIFCLAHSDLGTVDFVEGGV